MQNFNAGLMSTSLC